MDEVSKAALFIQNAQNFAECDRITFVWWASFFGVHREEEMIQPASVKNSVNYVSF